MLKARSRGTRRKTAGNDPVPQTAAAARDDCDFGANGDLTRRLIVPALYNLSRSGLLPQRLALVGVDHNDKSSEEWRDSLKQFLSDLLAKNSETLDDKLWQPIAQGMRFLKGDFTDDGAYQKLAGVLKELDQQQDS